MSENYERIYNENCKLREEHNITDIKLLDENNRLKNIIDELEKWLRKNINDINAYFENSPFGVDATYKEVFGVEATYKEVLDKLQELKEE